MKQFTKLAAAAAIIIAVMIGIDQFGGSIDGAGVAWAEVAKKLEQMPTHTCREKRIVTCDGKEIDFLTSDAVIYVWPEYGYREDMYNQYGQIMHRVYLLRAEKVSVTVIPALKQYKVTELTGELLNLFDKSWKQIIQQLKSGQYIELGRKTIEGVEVEGIEFSNPSIIVGSGYPVKFDSGLIRFWVDVESHLPVRAETEATTADKYVTVFTGGKPVDVEAVADEFQWNVELEASVFEPNITDGYTLISDEADSYDEGKAVLGLQSFAELTDGEYPAKLDMITVLQEGCPVIQEYINQDPDHQGNEKEIEKMRKTILSAKASCLFYDELVKQGKEVVYYGDTITTEDVDAVLMRWKISDDEYRVIFGDLTTENITMEQLAELERPSPE